MSSPLCARSDVDVMSIWSYIVLSQHVKFDGHYKKDKDSDNKWVWDGLRCHEDYIKYSLDRGYLVLDAENKTCITTLGRAVYKKEYEDAAKAHYEEYGYEMPQ